MEIILEILFCHSRAEEVLSLLGCDVMPADIHNFSNDPNAIRVVWL